MRPSPLLSAAAAAALLAAVAGPATAASPSPAKGLASSSVTLVGVAAGGHTVSAGTVELLSDMLGAESVAKILLTPLTADGKAYGQQTVTPANSPLTTPSVSTSALVPALNGLVGLSSPVLDASVTNIAGEPKTGAGATSLGGVSVLGLPVAVQGSLDVGSAVSKAGGAVGNKTVVVKNVALPSVADLLAALGLDVPKLPVDVLNELLKELNLVNTTVTALNKQISDATAQIQAQINTAQAAVDKAAADLAAETAKLGPLQTQLATAEADLAAKTQALQPLRDAVTSAQATLTTANATLASEQQKLADAQAAVAAFTAANALLPVPTQLTAAVTAAQSAVAAANTAVASATAAVTKANSDLAAAQNLADVAAAAVTALKNAIATVQATIDALQKVLDDAIKALQGILTSVQPLIDQLIGAIMAILDGTPLVSFDSLSIVTEATATTNKAGGQSAKVLGGEISGLKVLGTDVLSNVLGTTKVDLVDLAGTQLTAVNGLISQLTGKLSSVLSTVPQFPTLSVPAPQVGLLTKSSSTGISDGFGTAATSVKGLSITLPSVSVPSALALPGAVSLPALQGITQVAGLLTSAPIKIDLATLSSNARFAPAVGAAAQTPSTQVPDTGAPTTGTPDTSVPTATPGTAAPQLPRTGASQALALLGVALMTAAFVTRRRRSELLDELAG